MSDKKELESEIINNNNNNNDKTYFVLKCKQSSSSDKLYKLLNLYKLDYGITFFIKNEEGTLYNVSRISGSLQTFLDLKKEIEELHDDDADPCIYSQDEFLNYSLERRKKGDYDFFDNSVFFFPKHEDYSRVKENPKYYKFASEVMTEEEAESHKAHLEKRRREDMKDDRDDLFK